MVHVCDRHESRRSWDLRFHSPEPEYVPSRAGAQSVRAEKRFSTAQGCQPAAGGTDLGIAGGGGSWFDGAPMSLYVPAGSGRRPSAFGHGCARSARGARDFDLLQLERAGCAPRERTSGSAAASRRRYFLDLLDRSAQSQGDRRSAAGCHAQSRWRRAPRHSPIGRYSQRARGSGGELE
jgi:hypothetical protein